MVNHAQQGLRSRRLICALAAALGVAAGGASHAQAVRDNINIVGSSTVYPFATVVAEKFGRRNANFKTPMIESTGTGGGIKLFCAGVGVEHPDIANASRRIKPTEFDRLRQERRDGDRRGQDRLRRHRDREREERRGTTS